LVDVNLITHEASLLCISIKVGDEAEVLYFAAKSDAEREEWITAFRKGMRCNYIHWSS